MSAPVTGCTASSLSFSLPIQEHVPTRPFSTRIPIVENIHGTVVTDNFRWLEHRTDETEKWVSQQHALALSQIGRHPLCNWLSQRLDSLRRYDDTTVCERVAESDHLFFKTKTKEQNRWVYCMKKNKEAPFEIVLDPNTWQKEKTLDVTSPSLDGRYLAYGVATGGDENPVIRIRDLETGMDLPDTLSGWRQRSIRWHSANTGFYYTALPLRGTVPDKEEKYWHSIYYHQLGTSASEDRKVFFSETDKRLYHCVSISEDRRYEVFYRDHGSEKEVLFKRHGTDDPLTPLATGFDGDYNVSFFRDKLYILTDVGAPMQQMYVTDAATPGREHWRVLIPERALSKIEDFDIIEGRLYVKRLENAYTRIEIYDLEGRYLKDIPMPGIGTASVEGFQAIKPGVRLTFSSFFHPQETFEYTFETNALVSIHRTPIEVDPSRFQTQQAWFTSKDGTRVPMFILSGKDMIRDGSNPTYLTGYGGFNRNRSPAFSAEYLAFLEAGGIVAIPNLRGGGEFGRRWHEEGMKEKKQNVFDDFIAAAEFLLAERYTNPSRLAIGGGSNGGLLVGAALTQRPDLFRAVFCQVPLLDMVHYHEWGLANIWSTEYGSSVVPEEFSYLLKYSPYHNVKDQTAYPAVLVVGSENDARVDPCHGRKMVARLQEATISGLPILFYCEGQSGHVGGTTIGQQIEQHSRWYGFLMEQLGMRSPDMLCQLINPAHAEILSGSD